MLDHSLDGLRKSGVGMTPTTRSPMDGGGGEGRFGEPNGDGVPAHRAFPDLLELDLVVAVAELSDR